MLKTQFLIIVAPILLSFFNYFRGREKKNIWIVIPIIGILFFIVSLNWQLGLAAAVLYAIGESFGWGKWLQTVPLWHNKISQENYNKTPIHDRKQGFFHTIANAIINEEKDYENYSKLALIFRGAFWWMPIYIATWYFGFANLLIAIICGIIIGICMPISYSIAYSIKPSDYWGLGEKIYGGLQGCMLIILFLTNF